MNLEVVLCKCGSNNIKFVEESYMCDAMRCMDCGKTGPGFFDGEYTWALKAWNKQRKKEINESWKIGYVP